MERAIRRAVLDVLECTGCELDVKLLTDAREVEIRDDPGCIILIATGGTERTVAEIIEGIRCPVMLWSIPHHNSLPSALEVYSKFKHLPIKLFYSDINIGSFEEVNRFIKICNSLKKLKNFRLGCIGCTSEWILTSNKRELEEFGVHIVEIDLGEFVDEIKRTCLSGDVFKVIEGFGIDVSDEDLRISLKTYIALKNIISRYNLSAITVKCFDLLKHGITPCLGLSLVNDEGIVAGCEGDLQAVLTMIIVYLISERPCWMANLCRYDTDRNTITLAHCTIPTLMIEKSKSYLKSHMESKMGVAIDGFLENRDVTLVRLGYGKMVIASGRILKSGMRESYLCRTQVEVALRGDVEDLISNVLGNHHVLVYGDLKSELIDFCRFKGIEPIVIG